MAARTPARTPARVRTTRTRTARTRTARRRTALAVLAAVLLAVCPGFGPVQARADETTVSVDNLRTGWDGKEPGLSPSVVTSPSFGQRWSAPARLDGQVYAQPIAVGGTVVAATENNKVYGLDRTTGAAVWSRDLGPAWPAAALGCGDLTPTIGVTSTPVYDPATGAVYLTAKVNDGPLVNGVHDVLNPHWYMHALDPLTGDERPGFPVVIKGSPSNDPGTVFSPAYQMQRPGLLLLDGVVYAAFGGHCDHKPYRGYVVGVSTTGRSVTAMWTTEAGASNAGAGVWQAGGGLVSDGPGRIFLSTGNGVSPAPGPGGSPPGTLAESVVRLRVNAAGGLAAGDFFSPADAPVLDQRDTDLGSGGPVGLPDGFGTPAHPRLMVQQGKDGRVFLLDRDRLGGRAQGSGGTDAVVGVTGPLKGQWGHPAVWGGGGGYVYLVGNGGPLTALRRGTTGAGDPALTAVGTSQDTFPYTSGSPVVTSDGSDPGSALVWVVWSGGPSGANAQLRAYGAVPDAGGILPLVWSAPIGTAVKFATPATDGGQVYVGTRDGRVYAFGSPVGSPLAGSPLDFGQVPVGGTGRGTAVLTENQSPSGPLTIKGVAVKGPFTADTSALPPTLPAGGGLPIPVSFAPTAAGGVSGTLTVTTGAGDFALSLHGVGTSPGLAAAPARVSFTDQPTGTTGSVNVQVTNTGTQDEVVTAATPPGAPFTVRNLPGADPADPTTVPAQGSLVLQVGYAPTAAGSDASSITLTSTSGTLTLPVTGTAVSGRGNLVLTPPALAFGAVERGTSRTLGFTLTNTGNVPVTVTKAKAPAGVFSSADQLAEGLVIGPQQAVRQSVTFSPTATTGAATASYEVTGDAGQGAQYEGLSGTGVPPAAQRGALFARDAAGALWLYRGTGLPSAPLGPRTVVGSGLARAAGSGWKAYDAIVSLGGQRADGSGAVVARDTAGALWLIPGTGRPTAPLGNRIQVGTGWQVYNAVVGAGDVTGDGRADLLGRDGSGALWLYRATGSPRVPFAVRARIGTGWQVYNAVVGAGDVTGDGRADLLARDAGGVLWLYRATGSAAAPFAPRARIGTGWQVYNAVVRAGDVTGDGRADLLGRDGSGALWLHPGTGGAAAPFAARYRIGTGWQIYNALF
ncbi:choice-of-anchor D domain-containing protein [Streptomyces sp. NPDC001380]|uniref:choice-of-anchor D domain-containing protein n=1 Tax=Streptomyces sp. NPDC001380 TaxID=3364566 RepID=UPI003687C85E